MNVAQALEQCQSRNRAGDVVTDVQLAQWAQERERLMALVAEARRRARNIARGEDVSENLAELLVLGLGVD